MMDTKALITWIDSHDRPMPTRDNGNGTVTVYSVVAAIDAWGDWYNDIEAENIPATMKAARDLLGY